MKKLLLCLSALFLSVSFATAQTSFEISPSNGDIAAGAKDCEWNYTADNNPAGLKIVATDASGNRVNAISATSGASSKLKFSVFGVLEGTETYSKESTTFTVSVNENYLITGYCMIYTVSSASRITVADEYGYKVTPSSRTEPQTMSKDNISAQSIRFNLSAASFVNSYAAQVNSFTIYVQKVGGEAPVKYTVSATTSVGGTVTVNGGTDAVTTTGEVTLVAVPDYGYKFKNWTIGTEEVATTAEYTATVSSDTEFVAVFEKLTDTNDWYESIQKPTFGKTGNTTYINSAKVGDIVIEDIPEVLLGNDIPDVGKQSGVTNVIEVAAGAEFDLNITYQLNWGDLAIYQIDNDGATKEYGYYHGSWEPNGSTEKVVQYLEADERISVSEVVDGACTVTYPITINENHNPGDVIVVRAITGVTKNATNSAYEQNIVEGGYVDFLFVVTESVAEVWSSFYATFPAVIPEGIEAYIVTAVNSSYVTLTQIHDAIPANTGVILKGGSIEANINNYYSGEITADVTANLLMGSNNNSYITEEAYVLSNVDGEYGFYKALMTDGAWLNNANKAYLPASKVPASAAMSTSLRFDFGGTTGVEKVEIRNEKEEIYDLTGRRVNEITKAGVYVVNGKKILVK